MNRNQIVLYSVITVIFFSVVILVLHKETRGWDHDDDSAELKQNAASGKQAGPGDIYSQLNTTKRRIRRHRENEFDNPDEMLGEVERIEKLLQNTTNPDDKEELFMELDGLDHPRVYEIIYRELDDNNEKVREAALDLLLDVESEEMIPCIEKAMDDKNPELREMAVDLLGNIEVEGACQELLLKGTDDKSEDVRSAIFDVLDDKETSEQHYVYAQSIKSKRKDVKISTVEAIIDIPSHDSVQILFEGLKDKDKEFREEVNWHLDFLVSKEFSSYKEALDWWKNNSDRFDEELFEIP